MPTIDPVVLKLEADIREYNSRLTDAQRMTDQKLDAMDRRAQAMGQGIRRSFDTAATAAKSFAAVVGVGLLTKAIKDGLDYAANLGEIAASAGVSTTALQEMYYIGTQVNISQTEMVGLLQQLNRRLGEAASGTGQAGGALARLGVSLRDANGNVRDAAEIIPEIAEGMKSVASEAEKAALRNELFGRSGAKMAALLEGGAQGVNQLRDAAHRLGIVLNEDQIANADRTADKLAELKTVLSSRIAGVVADNANAIYGLANSLATLTNEAIRLAQEYPAARDALIGFGIGRAVGGPWGGLVGASTGYVYGVSQDRNRADANMDPAFRSQQLAQAQSALRDAQRNAEARQLAAAATGVVQSGTSVQNAAAEVARQLGLYNQAIRSAPSASSAVVAGAGAPVTAPRVSSGGGSARGGGSASRADPGPDLERIGWRFNAEMESLAQRSLMAMRTLATSAEERADIELRSIDLAERFALEELARESDYSQAQKDEVEARIRNLARIERLGVEFESAIQLEREAQGLADEEYRATQDGLRAQLDIADTQAERKRLALAMLDLEDQYRIALLEAVRNSQTASKYEKQRAQIALNALRQTAEARREGTSRANETAVERYLRELRRTPEQINEAIDGIRIDGLESLNDGIVDAIMGVKSLGSAFKSVANQIISDLLRIAVQRSIIEPLAGSLFGGGGGGGLLSRLFGRASGGFVAAGQMYRVNEGASPGRVEGFRPTGSGHIIPLGQMNAMAAQSGRGGGVAVVRLELSGDIDARIASTSADVAVEVVRQSSPAIVDRAARETMRRAGRPRL